MASRDSSAVTSLGGKPPGEAVTRLVASAGGKIYGLGVKLCGDRDEAEDLVQETFLQAFRKWEQFEGRSDPTSWLYTIAARACQRRRRRRAGEPQRLESLEDLLPAGEDRLPALASTGASAFDERLQREAEEVVDRALTALPLRFRLPLVLKEIAELPLREIAEILGVKESTVKTRVHRGRLALRRELAATLPGRPAEPADHPRQVCLDLLRAKMEALDRGVAFRVPEEELCARCRALFDSLDLTVHACRSIRDGELPPPLRRRLLAAIEEEAGEAGGGGVP